MTAEKIRTEKRGQLNLPRCPKCNKLILDGGQWSEDFATWVCSFEHPCEETATEPTWQQCPTYERIHMSDTFLEHAIGCECGCGYVVAPGYTETIVSKEFDNGKPYDGDAEVTKWCAWNLRYANGQG